MPSRLHPFVNDYYYHVYNKAIDDLQPFGEEVTSYYFLNLIRYYRYTQLKMSYSESLRLEPDTHSHYIYNIEKSKPKVKVITYCLMPNHFHLLLKQTKECGISKYVGDVLNGFTRFYNILHKRKGPIFLPCFHSKEITSEECLIHVSRYIHLNPYVGGIVKNKKDIWSYPYSSATMYLNNQSAFVYSKHILGLGYFLGNKDKYIKFVESEAEHKRTIALLKYTEK